MADIVGPLRPSDSWSTTEVRSIAHSHVWTIKGFSQCDVRYLETAVKIKDDRVPPPPMGSSIDQGQHLTFRIRLHPQGNKESNKDFSFFQVFSAQNNTKYRAKFAVYNVRNEELPTTVYTGTQQLHGYFEYIRRDLLVSHVLPSDELQLVLNLTVTFDTVTKSSQNSTKTKNEPEPRIHEVTQDMSKMFRDKKLTDFIIQVNDGKEIPVHKVMIAARSPVFAAMLEPHTEESQTNRVHIKDVEHDVMQELLSFIYTGQAPNLREMALEILAVADRFQLPGLKDMAEQQLRANLSCDTACRTLCIADMHNAIELKADAIRFIATNSPTILATDGWADMLANSPPLVTEVMMLMSEKQSSSSTSIPMEPPMKRVRFGLDTH